MSEPTYMQREMEQEVALTENREEILDMMAQAVADYFGADIGEHSNMNDPWKNAIDLLRRTTQPVTAGAERSAPSVPSNQGTEIPNGHREEESAPLAPKQESKTEPTP